MRFIFLAILIGYGYGAQAATWQRVGGLRFSQGGSYDLLEAPLVFGNPIPSAYLRISIPTSCNGVQVDRLTFSSPAGSRVKSHLESDTRDGAWVHWVYRHDMPPETVKSVGIELTIGSACEVQFYELPYEAPPPPGKPESKHCKKVAFNMYYDYEEQLDQSSAIDGNPCLVFLRFKDLKAYRYFLDDRQKKNLNPDFEILLPENVRVEMEHRVSQ